MSGRFEHKAAAASMPWSAADATGRTGNTFAEPFSTTSVSRALPTGWAGNYVDLQAIGADFQVSFSKGAQTLVYGQAAAIGSASAARGTTILNGTKLVGVVPSDATHINLICAVGTASGELEARCSEVLRSLT